MKVFVGQIYPEAGVSYPFKLQAQQFLGTKLTAIATPSAHYQEKYGDDFDLIFRMSATSECEQPKIKGPTVFKRDKDIEYTVFLPFDKSKAVDAFALREALRQFLNAAATVFEQLGMDGSELRTESEGIVAAIMTNNQMVDAHCNAPPGKKNGVTGVIIG